ncbi:excalibur calcium-binding domain-containing protein [Streptomyces sp. NPDC048606]|uniref:excalibur calcium-binding domain-containing protein n=1 Tax=Streptomyces sp. NPDC048606 TaxID=3154726 RepID=UPI00341F8552
MVIPPVGIALAWAGPWDKPKKIIATVLAGIWFFVPFLTDGGKKGAENGRDGKPAVTQSSPAPSPTSAEPTSSTSPTPLETPTAITTPSAAATPTRKATPTPAPARTTQAPKPPTSGNDTSGGSSTTSGGSSSGGSSTTSGGGGSVSYKNCDAVRAAGAAPIRRGDPGYGKHLDKDGDGVACER